MAGVLSRPVDDPVLVPKKPSGILSRIAAMPNPGYLVSQGVDRITTPGYPVDDALRGYMGRAPAFQPTLGQAASAWRDEGLGQTSEFLTALQRGDLDAVMNSSLFPMGAMTAYHGSPHKFDAFDLSKIGTGEGAQAYGHGLYFAENPKVAGSYREALSRNQVPLENPTFSGGVGYGQYLNKLRYSGDDGAANAAEQLRNFLMEGDTRDRLLFQGSDISKETSALKARLASQMEQAGPQYRGWYEDAIKGLDRVSKEIDPKDYAAGALYHVDIPDDEIAKMLDWDKPLRQQPESVRKAIEGWVGPEAFAELLKRGTTGRQLYSMAPAPNAANSNEAQKMASEHLRSIGIPGIKYLDGGSRGAGEGSRNIVLFDDKIPKIIKRE